MIRKLKEGISFEEAATNDAQVRQIVEDILSDIEQRGDKAVREYAEKFDNWTDENTLLSREHIDSCYKRLDDRVISDIKYAQEQVRNFAQIQKDALQLSLIHI